MKLERTCQTWLISYATIKSFGKRSMAIWMSRGCLWQVGAKAKVTADAQ
jgi:hypothetical protein